MRISGGQIGIGALENDLAKVIDENLALGNRKIVVPYRSDDRRQDSAGYKKLGEE